MAAVYWCSKPKHTNSQVFLGKEQWPPKKRKKKGRRRSTGGSSRFCANARPIHDGASKIIWRERVCNLRTGNQRPRSGGVDMDRPLQLVTDCLATIFFVTPSSVRKIDSGALWVEPILHRVVGRYFCKYKKNFTPTLLHIFAKMYYPIFSAMSDRTSMFPTATALIASISRWASPHHQLPTVYKHDKIWASETFSFWRYVIYLNVTLRS